MAAQRAIQITLRPHPRNFAGTRGAMMCDAAIYCLEHLGHSGKDTPLQISGAKSSAVRVRWKPLPPATRSLFRDPIESTEHGAYGISLLAIRKLYARCEIERSRAGTGFDWRLTFGRKSSPLPFVGRTIRLEVTGTMNPDESIAARLTRKRIQLAAGTGSGPSMIALVDFTLPKLTIVDVP